MLFRSIFHSKSLRMDRERLLKLGYFYDVSTPKLTKSTANGGVDITFHVSEKKVNRVDLGLEQEEEKFVSFLQTKYHHGLIKSDQLSAKMQVGVLDDKLNLTSYSVRYHQPWLFNQSPISFTADVWTELNQEYFSQTSVNGLGDLIKNKRQGWDVIFGFPIKEDWLHFSLKLKDEVVSPRDGETLFERYRLNSVSGILSYQTIDDWTNPTQGTYWQFKFEKGGNLGLYQLAGLDFSKVDLNAASFFSLTDTSVLGLHANMGIFRPHGSESQTFEAEGYEIGGASTIRGYKDDPPLTGFRKMVFNVEYRQQLSPSFQEIGRAHV